MNESQWKVEQLNEYTTVLRNFLKTNEITLQKMKCPFCSTDLDSGWKCPLNHPILWCSRTFRIITSILLPHTHTATSGLLKCPTCHALSYDLSKENGFQWIKALTNRFQCCSQCDTLLIPFSLSLWKFNLKPISGHLQQTVNLTQSSLIEISLSSKRMTKINSLFPRN
jgi:hypothetical protein